MRQKKENVRQHRKENNKKRKQIARIKDSHKKQRILWPIKKVGTWENRKENTWTNECQRCGGVYKNWQQQ